MPHKFKAHAPGSLMLLGEYAVLQGKQALVCAVDKRITVTLIPRNDERIEIQSKAYGHYATTISELNIEKPFHFVLATLKQYQKRLRYGCNIEVAADFADNIGFGSSAAVTVATLSALTMWLDIRMTPLDLIRQGRMIIQEVQGMGSGADIAASTYGGIVGFQPQPLAAEKFSLTHPLTALYCGFKTKTADAIKHVQEKFAPHPQLFRVINNTIGQCVIEGIQFLRQGEWTRFGEIMNIQQGLMESLGVSTPLLRNMVTDLSLQPKIIGAKISGSGLGDCVIGLGKLSRKYLFAEGKEEVRHIPIEMTLQGVQCEKI